MFEKRHGSYLNLKQPFLALSACFIIMNLFISYFDMRYMENLRHDNDRVLLAWNVGSIPSSFGNVNLMTGDPDVISRAVSEHATHINYVVRSLQQKLTESNISGRVLQLHGPNSGDSIVKAATQEGADMIVVGSRGLGTIRRTFLGSVSDFVLHHAHIPVCICKFDDLTTKYQ